MRIRFTLIRLLVLICFVSGYEYTKAQYISINDGLSSRNITCMLQDQYGLIWIGTENGLNGYDGYSFKSYSTYTQGIRLPNVRVSYLLETRDGSIWVGTFSGLCRIAADRKTSYTIELPPLRITSVLQLNNGTIIFGADDGYIYKIVHDKAEKVYYLGRRCGLFGLTTNSRGEIYFHTDCSRMIYKLKSDFVKDPSFAFTDTLNSRFILTGSTLIASCKSHHGIALLDADHLKKIPSPGLDQLNALHPDALTIFEDKEKNIWAGYRDGKLVKVNLRNGSLQNYSSYFIQDYFGSKISCILEDRNGLIWVGTDGGIVKINKGFSHFSANNLSTENKVSARGITSDKHNNIYVVSHKGLFVVDTKTQSATNYRVPDYPDKNENNFVGVLWKDSMNLMIASFHRGLLNFNLSTKKFTSLVKNDTGNVNKNLICMFKDRSNTIWVGSHRGLKIYDPGSRIIYPYSDASGNQVLPKTSIWKIVEHDGLLWLATPRGLFTINRATGILKQYNLYSTPALPAEDLYSITVDDAQHLWLACRGGGILRLNTHTFQTEHYTPENGLCNSVVYAIIKHNGFLWISTENGLSKFNIRTKTFVNYFAKDGLADDEFNAGSYCHAPNGQIIMGGINGITTFYPDSIPEHSNPASLIITHIEAGDSTFDSPQYLNTVEPALITLPYDNTNLSINMAVTDYYSPSVNTFSYKIVGLDHEWNSLGTQHLIRINQIPAGKYTLLIKGKNYNGIETSNTISLKLHVEQVFYKKPWFIVLLCVVVLSLIFLFFQMRIRHILRLQKLRTRIASDLHDEVGSMLTRISILSEMLRFKNRDSEEVRQIAIASNKATTTMSDMLWSIDSRNDKIENLVDRMREHADSLLLPLNISIDFVTNESIEGKIIGMQLRQNMLFIFKEAINNIARHSGASMVHILLQHKDRVLTMRIHDNGTGTINNSIGSGQGLSNMKMRATEVKATLDIDATNGYTIIFTKKI